MYSSYCLLSAHVVSMLLGKVYDCRITKDTACIGVLCFIVLCHVILNKYYHLHGNTSTNSQGIEDTSYSTKFVSLMKQRIEKVKEVCKQEIYEYDPLTMQNERPYWLFNAKNIAFCPVTKAASTSWKLNLVQLFYNNDTIQKALNQTIDGMSPDALALRLITRPNKSTIFEWKENTTLRKDALVSFIVIRHPFDRLVSAFRSIFETELPCINPTLCTDETRWFVEIRTDIINNFRHKGEKIGKQASEEVLLASNDRNTYISKFGVSMFPTFWEFVQAILSNKDEWQQNDKAKKLKKHWDTISQQCFVCQPEYINNLQYLLKYENLHEEQDMFLKHVKWNTIMRDPAQSRITYLNVTNMKNSAAHHTPLGTAKVYFKTLQSDDVIALWNKYKVDFELFDYIFELDDWIS